MTPKQEAALRQAREAFEYIENNYMSLPTPAIKALAAIREALAEQPAQQEPKSVAMADYMALTEKYVALKAQRKPWVGLSNDEIYDMYNEPRSDAEMVEFARAIEAKLKERNT